MANITRLELHIFDDASKEACATVCYTRMVNHDAVLNRQVKAVTNLAPLKTISVYKLEPTAALMGV